MKGPGRAAGGGLAARAADLRRAFDRSFAEAAGAAAVEVEDLLAIRVGGDPCALRLAEVRGLFADRRVVGLPKARPGLLGLAGLRGSLVPVYDLGALLGYPPAAAPRWLVLAAAAPIGLAFEAFEGHLRLARGALVEGGGEAGRRRHAREVARTPDRPRPIVDVASVIQALRREEG